jgi:hypothetical protein
MTEAGSRILRAAAILLSLAGPALAQTEPNEEARRFLVYPPNKIISFSGAPDGSWYLHYDGPQLRKGNGYYNLIVQVSRFAKEENAVAGCEGVRDVSIEGKTIRRIEGYPCAFVQESTSGTGPNATRYRSSWYAKGRYFVSLGEGAQPASLLPASPPVGPLLAALNGEQPLAPGEIAFRNLLFAALGFGGDAARSCLDEVMNTAEAAAARDPKMADEIAQLRKAAAGAHAIEVLAAVPVGPAHFDDFDPKWWDALKEVVPNPTSTPDPQDTATDRVIDLLPPPFNVLVNIARTGSKTMRAIKTHVADPTVHREVYACYRRKREGSGGTPIAENIGQDALESEAAQILHDAIGAGCKAPNSFKNSYEAQLKGFTTKEAREKEFARLLRPLAVRFEFIYRVEDAKARRETLIAGRWAPAQDILTRLKARVNVCIADRASKSR